MALVGPTGAGKTTTLVKLAGKFMLTDFGGYKMSVALMTVDAFKIGAIEQLQSYADILKLPLATARTREDLEREIGLQKGNVDLILVDTIGRSLREHSGLGEMQEVLDACGKDAEVHLVVPATLTTKNLTTLIEQFEPFGCRAVLVTKLDDVSGGVGNVLSALAEKGKAVSYVTDGQNAHEYLRQADALVFLKCLTGFTVDREEAAAAAGRNDGIEGVNGRSG